MASKNLVKRIRARWIYTWVGVALLAAWSPAGLGSSVVGNGGSIVYEYLKTTQDQTFNVYDFIAHRSDYQEVITRLCSSPSNLFGRETTLAKTAYCEEFIGLSLMQFNELVPKLVIKLGENLTALGPDRLPIACDARTDATGPIEFDYQRVRYYSPYQMLYLMFYEIGHKIKVGNNQFVNDYDPVGPFAQGSELLRGTSRTLTTLALDRGFIGQHFALMDKFFCEVQTLADNGTPIFSPIQITGTVPRWTKREPEGYYAGFGFAALSGITLEFRDEVTRDPLSLRLQISEFANCEPLQREDLALRSTVLELTKIRGSNENPREDVVAREERPSNPICASAPPVQLTYQHHRISCGYEGSFAFPFVPPPD